MHTALVCIAALTLDALMGEPRRGHPLVAFGKLAARLEHRLNAGAGAGIAAGALAAGLLLVLPLAAAVWAAVTLPPLPLLALDAVVLYLAVGLRSLGEHARAVALPLAAGDLAAARRGVAALVSRDAERLEETGVAGAAVESVLENGADAVFASVFWYVLAGTPGVVLHRLVNTLDAMWGYRTPRFDRFGRVVARLDDLLNWAPARLTALSYALAGRAGAALRCWRAQAPGWSSPNAGPVMAAGAGALGVTLGGPAPYPDGWRQRPRLGEGAAPGAHTIAAAVALVRRAVVLWLALILAGGVAWSLTTAAG